MNTTIYEFLTECLKNQDVVEKSVGYIPWGVRDACAKFEENRRRKERARRVRKTRITNMIASSLRDSDKKAMRPTEIQFAIYRKYGEELTCSAIVYYALIMCDEKTLLRFTSGSQVYYTLE